RASRRGARVNEPVIRGRIKVDARRALHKLRDHMLVDLHLYTTEIARAAAALGATKLDVRWDSSDVVLAFDGRTPDPSVVASVRDHVLGGEGLSSGDTEDALRSLGIGITAALGLAPAFVEVSCGSDTL